MVAPRPDEYAKHHYSSGCQERSGRMRHNIRFSKDLYDQILVEAKSRGWSFNRMVRHLCEASINGIE